MADEEQQVLLCYKCLQYKPTVKKPIGNNPNRTSRHYDDKHPLTVRKKKKCTNCGQSFDFDHEKNDHPCV